VERPLPPLPAVLSFIDAINAGDLERLGRLMTEDHRLLIMEEPPVEGRAANLRAWRGYMTSFPHYLIRPVRLAEDGERVAVLGSTTGSHLGIPDEEEIAQLLIWVAKVERGKLASWMLLEDSPAQREALGLDLIPG
jgi:ketosteroid isomerase-like protein